MANTKNLLVYVPSNAVTDFITKHTGSAITSSDGYYEKVSFLEGQGTIATHGKIFGTSKDFADDVAEFKNRVGLTDDITTSSTLTAYAKTVGASVEILNGNASTNGSVDKKIKDAIDGLVGNAPDAYNTVYELAAWLQQVQGTGTAEAVAATLASVPTIEARLGTYGVGTYSGAYQFAHNAVTEAVSALKTSLQITDAAVTGQYVSAVSISGDGAVTISRESLPTLSIDTNSTNLMTVNDHVVGVVVTDLGSASGISYTKTNNVTTYSATTQTVSDGLITASAVYNRIHSTEVFIADAFTTIDARIASVVAGATNELDSSITVSSTDGSDTLGSVTIAQEDGKLKESTSSLVINKANILKDASATVDSPVSGTGANEYIQVHVTEENHKVTTVTVDFSPWEEYSVQTP